MSSYKFLEATKNRPPSELLVEAVDLVKEKKRALDLGSGAFRDTYFLVEKGFAVDAIDKSKNVATYFDNKSKFNFYNVPFEKFVFEKDVYNLINAQYSLPFTNSDTFFIILNNIFTSLTSDGIFVGQFFGREDEWSSNTEMTFLSRFDVEKIFEQYTIHKLEESIYQGKTAVGDIKKWHIFNFIVSK